MEKLVKKPFRHSFSEKIFFIKKDFSFVYELATFQELANITRLKEQYQIIYWVEQFLIGKIPKFYINKISFQKKIGIFNAVLQKLGGGFFSEVKGKETDQKQTSPNSSWICYLLEKTSHNLRDILRLNWREIEFLLEGVGWNANEQTDKGRIQNKKYFKGKGFDKAETLEQMRKNRQLREKNLKN